MTTTQAFQIKPDFYTTIESCIQGTSKKTDIQTNPRYKYYRQTHFTAGDEEQFEQYRDQTNENVCIPEISLNTNLFADQILYVWGKYTNITADSTINTFRYIFHKFKKGIFVKIASNQLRVFLPFSKAHFVNEWSSKIQVNKAKYGTINEFIARISQAEGRQYNSKFVNQNTDEWYANNCLVRYEYPIHEGDSNVGNLKNMLEELCKTRKLPDIEFFVNRRDFPIITTDETEPYNNIWGTTEKQLVSHNYNKYLPILSMSTTEKYADVLMPTYEDWGRVQTKKNIFFPDICNKYNVVFDIPWEHKKPTAVFRGSTTGCGVSIETNTRLKVSYLSYITQPDEQGIPYLDAGITKWNLRPRKLQDNDYLETIDTKKLPFQLAHHLSLKQQSEYKYIINIDGHVTAFRLSIELNMGSVILWAKTKWKIWYSDLLIPYKHYVPVKEDLSDLIQQIKWCREHDQECQEIVKNAKEFFNEYLQENGILDYLQKVLVNLKSKMGVYLYNVLSPLDTTIHNEFQSLDFSHPKTDKNIDNLSIIPNMGRCYGLLQGLEWVVRKIIKEKHFEEIAQEQNEIFKNKLGYIRHFYMSGFPFAVKTTANNQKIREHIHECYVGTKSINELCKYIPNFAYIFGIYRKNETLNVITEFIQGQTLHEYISSPGFKFSVYIDIIKQLSYAIHMAQDICGLVHYDCTPWNIILQITQKPVTINYIIDHNQVVEIKTSIIPIIIDYGKSHIIHDGEHHGFVNMFKVSTSQDILTLLITTIDQILNGRNNQLLPYNDFSNLIHLANFLSGTKFCPNKFDRKKASELRLFFRKVSKFSFLIENNKYELENRTPLDLVQYINTNITPNQPTIIINTFTSIMDKGNGRQVFEYILSNSIEEQAKTYENVFIRLKQCTLPQPNNIFFIYYAAQQLENNLNSVRENMMVFLQINNIDTSQYEQLFIETIKLIYKIYKPQISKMKYLNIDYTISGQFHTLIHAPYTQETFLLPSNVLSMLSTGYDTDLSEYREIIVMILLYNGVFSLNEQDRQHYLKNFEQLLNIKPLNMKNNTANKKTLQNLAKTIYKENLNTLKTQILVEKGNCQDAEKYLEVYNKF